MIKTIIKNDGRLEDFEPSKINKWGEWAAKTLGKQVDWSSVVLDTVSFLPEVCTSLQLQERLIQTCLEYDTWSYNKMAGRLYTPIIYKKLYNNIIPSIKDLHSKLLFLGLMEKLNYTDDEYAQAELMIDHGLDLKSTHFELKYTFFKYAIQNRVTNDVYESQQFVYMRMAMALAQYEPESEKMMHVSNLYRLFSGKKLSAPTPNYVNLGTRLRGYASCCLYTTNDNIPSLGIGDWIAYRMTAMSAGIGNHLKCRSILEPVRNGAFKHNGKLPYYRSMRGAVKANMQASRGGALTTYWNGFDPEGETIVHLKNPMSTEDKKIRDIDYNFGSNKFFARKVAREEKVFGFNVNSAPDLYAALYSDNDTLFAELYEKYLNDDSFHKVWIDARNLVIDASAEGYITGRAYLHWIDEMNRHTPFKEPIYSSNLCAEICEHTAGYDDILDLESTEDHGRGEIAMCSLAAVNVANIESDEEYAEVCYYALFMIDRCIGMSDYPFKHLELTAKSRMNAGVGMMGLAHLMAKKRKKYSTQDGKDFIHELAETHYWHLVNASLRISKERGLAPWMHKTKWPEGWLPIDTYNRSVDEIVTVENKRDWESLRKEIIINRGIGHTVLCAYMPGESSSKSCGTTNSIYPVRDITLNKSDDAINIYWVAPESDKIGHWYELAWNIPTRDMIDDYAIIQKWTDQAISADLYEDISGEESSVNSDSVISDYLYMTKRGLKTRYYFNTKTSNGTNLDNSDKPVCGSDGCTL